MNFIARKIKEKARENGIILDIDLFIVERKKDKAVANNQLKTIKSKEIAEFFKNKTLKMMKFKKHHNSIYLERELIDLLVETGLSRKCAENVSTALKMRGKKVPSADTLLRRIEQFTYEEIIKNFDVLLENLWITVRKNRFYTSTRGVKTIIDFTDWDFKGKHTKMTIGKISPTGNKIKCFRFGTMDILDTEGCYTLKALPIHPLSKKEDILYRLLLDGKKKVKIEIALVDRGFFTEKCIEVFNKLNIPYLMPVIRNEKIKKIEEHAPTPLIVKDVEMKSVKYNLIIVKKDDKNLLFATNMDLTQEKDSNLTNYLCDLYGKRWGIENGYKTKKEFRPMTTSRDYKVRLFYFLLTIFLYDLWILVRVLIDISLYSRKRKKSSITAYVFGQLFLSNDYG